jgi:hypothetical protein
MLDPVEECFSVASVPRRRSAWLILSEDFDTHAFEDMAVKLASQVSLEGTPQVARPQMPSVTREKHDLCSVTARSELVRASNRRNAAFDPETLLDDFELHEIGRINNLDALHQVSPVVRALNGRANAGLVAFGSHRVWQQEAQEERRTHGDLFV